MSEMKTMDGNTAAAHVAYHFTDVAAIYPITPSSPMAEMVDQWSANGRKNIFDQEVKLTELQSEGGAAGAVHGSLAAGALTTTFTASQGLLLMLPNIYKMAGELLPGVLHVSARTVATHALSIYGDHSDVMACRQTGAGMLASGSVQEVMDMAAITHIAALRSSLPFIHFFDGFRTSHEIQKIDVLTYEELAGLFPHEAAEALREKALKPEEPVTRGTAQNPDIFFQAREAVNPFYEKAPDVVAECMKDIEELTGREYLPFNYYGAEDAEHVIVAMGSVTSTVEETVDYLRGRGEKVGLINVHLYRPFSAKYFARALPESVRRIAVLDRTKEPGAVGEPLYQDVRSFFYDRDEQPLVVGGRYGLSSKDTRPSHIKSVYDNLKKSNPSDGFTVGIEDDVSSSSLEVMESIDASPEGTTRCKFWGFGSDGTVSANKNAIKIIGDNTDLYAQGYFSYDAKKSGGVTVSHLRFGEEEIKSTYLIERADYVACHNEAYVNKFDMHSDLKPGGTFLLNCTWPQDELGDKLPGELKRYLAKNDINFYIIDGVNIAEEVGLGRRINMIMQTCFFRLAEIIPIDDAISYLKEAVKKSYGHKGEKIVEMNHRAIDRSLESLEQVDVPENWAEAEAAEEEEKPERPEFIEKVLEPIARQEGNDLPVSTFSGREDGSFPQGVSRFEKRGIALQVPDWLEDNCIQCNQCAYVCPHSVIRPFLLNNEEKQEGPEELSLLEARGRGIDDYYYRIQMSPLDCTGCGVCVETCPAPEKALKMKDFSMMVEKEKDNWDYLIENVSSKQEAVNKSNVKGSQFSKPLLEFHGACAGCGETAYARLITQLFGERMLIANATGCSSIWGGTAPSTVYTRGANGEGPAWANSLFEDNAEYGYGMHLGNEQLRERLAAHVKAALNGEEISQELSELLKSWLEHKDEGEKSQELSRQIRDELPEEGDSEHLEKIKELKSYFTRRSQWIFGGDGWAYDIGFGGLDHVLASGEDVNVLIFDTEVYSNTGGQSSKATPTAAAAKFASSGKKTQKKDLGQMLMTYGYIYVAQVALGADMNQTLKAINEAESFDGPAVIIAYSPCIAQGIKGGMSESVNQQERAVKSGYWHLYRFNPELKEEGENPFSLDSEEPEESFRDFLLSEVRFTSLKQKFPETAERLFEKAEKDARERYQTYRRLEESFAPDSNED